MQVWETQVTVMVLSQLQILALGYPPQETPVIINCSTKYWNQTAEMTFFRMSALPQLLVFLVTPPELLLLQQALQ